MARPHIEFVHAQQLPWQDAALEAAPWAGLPAKLLSRDPEAGDCSLLLRLPAGFRAATTPGARPLELFVLEGECSVGATALGLDGYADLAPGAIPGALLARRDSVVLAFVGRPAAAGAGPAPAPRLIDTHSTPWTRHDIDPAVQFLNLAHKLLRDDAVTGERTLLLSTGAQTHPRDWREAQLRHDCVEEMYLLGGDIIGERGVMYEGAYFWRPPGLWHGPFGSRRGSLSLIRFVGGRHRNHWSEQVLPFSLTPAHAPALPAELDAVAGSAWRPPAY